MEVIMNMDEQVALLMQGTEYGDEELKKNMAAELRQRLLEARAGRPAAAHLLRVRSAHLRPAPGPHRADAQTAPVPGAGA